MTKVLIAGCGYLGMALGVRLKTGGAQVWGLRRNWLGHAPEGIQKIEADLLKPESLQTLPKVDWTVLCQAPSRPDDSYEKTYYRGTRNLIAAMRGKCPRFLSISSTRVYTTSDGSWVNEETDPGAGGKMTDNSRWLLETERWAFQNSSSIVFRLGGLYGPGRNRLISRDPIKVPEAYVNRIHVDDAVSGIELLFEKGKPGEIYLGVDDRPSGKEGSLGKRCSNAKIKRLGLRLKYPTRVEV